MGNRGVQAALVAVVLVFGALAALVVGNARKGQVAHTTPTPAASASEAPSPSPSSSPSAPASASPSAEPSPTAAPSESPTAAPQPARSQPAPSGGGSTASGPAAYPAQISAGSSYPYRGSGTLVAHATDSIDSGSSVCAGINESTQNFPANTRGVFFVGVQFSDGQILASGYIRTSGTRADFASVQDAGGSNRQGVVGADPGAGSHTYCVSRSGAAWSMTRDGTQLFSTTREAATDVRGAVVKFDNDVEPISGDTAAATTLLVPGFHDISVGGQPPRQLRGATFYA
ncbi:MAG: hypothetical protein ABR598_08270 [Candidatus Dormibacteria bacterium]